MIRAEQLCARRGGFTLGPIDIDLTGDSYLTLLGPSGAGKTLFLETCMGLIAPSGGRIWMGGEDVTRATPEKRQISYLPQDLTLFPHLDVRQNILFGAKRRQLNRDFVSTRLAELFDLLDLHNIVHRGDVNTLSGGEKQRVALARALLPSPRMLFLDEPFSALDATIKRQLQVKLREINRQLGVTIIHVTHDQEEAFMLGELIAVMIRGQLHQVGSRDDIYYRPATIDVARFLRNQNIFDMTVADIMPDGSLLLVNGIQLVARGPAGARRGSRTAVGIRSEEVMVIRPDRPIGPDLQDNLFHARVEDILIFGGTHTLCVRLQDSDITVDVELPNCAMRDLGYTIGDRLRVCLRKRSLWTIPLPADPPAGEATHDQLR